MSSPLFGTICLVGIGLINSSIARAARLHGLAARIVTLDASEQACETALRLGIVDAAGSDPAALLAEADLIMVGTPVGAMAAVGQAIGPHLKAGAIVSDVGSVKMAVVRDLLPHLPDTVHFVPGHPIAGTEHSGPEAGFAELFQGRWCILTPLPGTDPGAIDKVTQLWTAMGSMIEIMEPLHHDKVLAITSHLPHLIAYTIVGTASDLEGDMQQEVIKFSASGFRDFTRIAASDPIMWRDIFLNNKEAVLEIIQRFTEDLTALQRAIRWGEAETLETHFRETRAIRRAIIDAKQA
ncbi:Protein tyrC: Cyclohexadienyl dehydrogenase (Arogenate dehydrogenase) (ADH); Prephenate dehydrogenase (PDH) [Magnetospirillum gryphiswaldense MSR-1 v2]|uniref:prephenate dehydrogenase n=1 Tax=Magnetospirillum gryphiswaldense (strain DSM 6361 / JCM 21280 / NBRC 15271 / MSR-1) TaxID=431944 RepID=V6F7E4_MAGGM|nr:prephenate/arogenate dehydrogenase family protein [Magnetospirillum gryphiswaldense]CDL01379.1 Protein tyrC: Cyclohexadienyl dehydrogenase (Arogenate dehydrogenase) (ADH); Prephenate dehydrogenase (PDH) [Magnetospirillum gryphiswaldense MSR-1 v2]